MKIVKTILILLGTVLAGAVLGAVVLAVVCMASGGGGGGEWARFAILGALILGAAGGGLLGLLGSIIWVVSINRAKQ